MRFCLLGRSVNRGISSRIQKNVLLAPYTTFGIGGPAKYFTKAESIDEVRELCDWAKEKELPVFVLGGGSNILVSDNGFNGLVIKNKSKNIEVKGKKIFADSGVSLSRTIQEAIQNDLTGLEWGMGIPGTVGGAVCDNSGAFGKQTSDVLKYAKVLDLKKLSVKKFSNSDCDFYYRDSIFKRDPNWVILEAVFVLKKDDADKIKENIKDYAKLRMGTQDASHKCAGCFFKNIDWKRKDINKHELIKKFPELKQFVDKPKISAGFLIDFLGLKNKKIGDAVVSDKHANFILNLGNANAEQIMMLVAMIKGKVSARYGFSLEEEVQLIGFD